ncbi:hypothetical protein [Streptomyces sp. 1222.5]|uniref:hypothetical protein n=1 Tax=Streptomyces sp. 1222.5 TaxID=1881026 RepID=UPI003EBEDDEF
MAEWEITLLNGVVSAFAALVVGALAFYAAFRQGSKALQAAERQSIAAIQAAVEASRGQLELARWQSRRDTYVKFLAVADEWSEKASAAASTRDASERQTMQDELLDVFRQLRSHIDLILLEGPEESIGDAVRSVRLKAQAELLVLNTQLHDLRRRSRSDDHGNWINASTAYIDSLDAVKKEMYQVLHATAGRPMAQSG